jgi:PAS domain S-box-containing protein
VTRDQSLEADRSRDDRLLAIVEYSDEAIIAATLDGVITGWNPAAEKIFGYSGEEILGQSNERLTPPDLRNEMVAIRVKVRAGQHVEHLQTLRVRKDGRVFTVSLSVSPIHNADGAVVGTSTIARDVSEVRRAFDAARFMIEASLDSLVAISPEGKITDANQATVKLTGVPRDELIGTSFSDYFTDPVKAEEIYQQVFSEGMAVDYPLTLRQGAGHKTLTEVLYNASVYRDADGKVLGVFAAARDVTNQMQAQREIAVQQAAALDRLAELERFQRLTVGRELKMIELKKENEYLRKFGPTDGGESSDQRPREVPRTDVRGPTAKHDPEHRTPS